MIVDGSKEWDAILKEIGHFCDKNSNAEEQIIVEGYSTFILITYTIIKNKRLIKVDSPQIHADLFYMLLPSTRTQILKEMLVMFRGKNA